MTEREKRLQASLSHLLQMLDYATITFSDLAPERAQETALEFDEAYVAACEALEATDDAPHRSARMVMTRAQREPVSVGAGIGDAQEG